MKKTRHCFIFLLLVVSVIQFFAFDNKSVNAADDKVIISTEINETDNTDLQRVDAEARNGLQKICELLDKNYSKTIYIKITKDGICKTSRGIVYLPIWHVRNKKADIVHEITHIVAPHFENRFFSEGLAVCCQEKFGKDNGFPNFEGKQLDNIVRNYKTSLIPLADLEKNNGMFLNIESKERKIAYIEAGSFINYLLETYGNEKLRDLNNSSSLDYKLVYGKDINYLETEWKQYVLHEEINTNK